MTAPGDANTCFTDFALQEYVHGRLDADVRVEVETHAATCRECADAITVLQVETSLLRAALRGDAVPAASLSDELLLARYLDGALDEARAEALESRLASDPALLYCLVQLRQEADAALTEQDAGVRDPVPEIPEGQILRMPKRAAPPLVVAHGLKFGGGHAG